MRFPDTDVVIIGAGAIGSAIARELSKYRIDVCLLEKEADVCEGTSKANSAIIHTGFDAPPGSLEASLVRRSNYLFDEVCQDLDVPFARPGALMVAIDEEQMSLLYRNLEKGRANGVWDLELLNHDDLCRLEPNISPQALGALFIPRESLICPFSYVTALVENAYANGVRLLLETKAERILTANGRVTGVETNRGSIRTKFVVNATGLYTDEISETAGIRHFTITPRKGEFFVLDKEARVLVNHIILPVPTPISKGILVAPTIDGNLIVGPTADDMKDKADKSTSIDGLQRVMVGAQRLVPAVSRGLAITQYAGLRAAGDAPDYIIGPYQALPGFINAANIRSTGLTSSLAVAEFIVDILKEEGLPLEAKKAFQRIRKGIKRFRDLAPDEKEEAIRENPQYGNIICRCETVTEAEIVAAIQRPAGARTLDGVKRRTRAGMGRCQGGYCSPRVLVILARELGLDPLEVTKRGGGSTILAGMTKGMWKERAKCHAN